MAKFMKIGCSCEPLLGKGAFTEYCFVAAQFHDLGESLSVVIIRHILGKHAFEHCCRDVLRFCL